MSPGKLEFVLVLLSVGFNYSSDSFHYLPRAFFPPTERLIFFLSLTSTSRMKPRFSTLVYPLTLSLLLRLFTLFFFLCLSILWGMDQPLGLHRLDQKLQGCAPSRFPPQGFLSNSLSPYSLPSFSSTNLSLLYILIHSLLRSFLSLSFLFNFLLLFLYFISSYCGR